METIYYFKPIICLLDDYLLFKLLFKTDKKQLYFPKYPIEKEIKSHKQIQEQVHKLEKLFIDLNIKIANVNIIESFCLKQITKTEKEWSIGTGISLEDVRVEVKEIFPALYEMLSVFGSKQIRNKATFGGNIGSASPIGDTTPVLMAYNSVLVLKNTKAEREIKLREFITGYRTTQMNHDELIIAVKIPIPNKTEIIKSYKISKRKDLDISTVSACFNLTKDEKSIVKDIFIVYGGMAATTSRATKTEKFLIGKQWNRENIEKAMKLIDEDFTPISDARSGAEARKIMARNLMMKFYNDTNKS